MKQKDKQRKEKKEKQRHNSDEDLAPVEEDSEHERHLPPRKRSKTVPAITFTTVSSDKESSKLTKKNGDRPEDYHKKKEKKRKGDSSESSSSDQEEKQVAPKKRKKSKHHQEPDEEIEEPAPRRRKLSTSGQPSSQVRIPKVRKEFKQQVSYSSIRLFFLLLLDGNNFGFRYKMKEGSSDTETNSSSSERCSPGSVATLNSKKSRRPSLKLLRVAASEKCDDLASFLEKNHDEIFNICAHFNDLPVVKDLIAQYKDLKESLNAPILVSLAGAQGTGKSTVSSN